MITTQQLADKLRLAWNNSKQQHTEHWDTLYEMDQAAYLAVAEAAIEVFLEGTLFRDIFETERKRAAHLKDVNADQRVQIEHLEQQLVETGGVLSDKDSTIRRLKEKLENVDVVSIEKHRQIEDSNKRLADQLAKAATYIEALERDLSFYRAISNLVKSHEEMR